MVWDVPAGDHVVLRRVPIKRAFSRYLSSLSLISQRTSLVQQNNVWSTKTYCNLQRVHSSGVLRVRRQPTRGVDAKTMSRFCDGVVPTLPEARSRSYGRG